MEQRSKAVLRFLVLCALVHGIQGFSCWANWKFYKKHKGYWKTKCTYCECLGSFKWKCVDHCVPPKPTPKKGLPMCPNTTVLKDIIVKSHVKQGKNETEGKKGDWLVFDLKEDVILYSIMYTGKIGRAQGDGMREFSIALSMTNTDYYEVEKVDLQYQFPMVQQDYRYVTRFLKFTYLDASGNFNASFTVKGCQAATCRQCQHPLLCKMEQAQCKLPDFCSFQAACKCKQGYELNKDKRTCSDIDECKVKGYCPQQCKNLPGSFTCNCKKGYRMSADKMKCIDIDECKETYPCSQICHNTPGSYNCSCKPGFQLLSDQRTCKDIDECRNPDTCGQICTNVPGTYKCSCNDGFKMEPDHKTCKDIDECAVNNGGCDQLCVNQPGSYYCLCNNGFVENKVTKKCEDLDECINGPCSQGCINTVGSFHCTCNSGYELKFGVRCEDIDECQNSTLNECDPASTTCQNVAGSYFCDCKTNFLRKDNITCTAVRCPAIADTGSTQITPSDCITSNSKEAGAICSVSCAEGYITDVQIPVNLTCKANGYWDGDIPTCNIITCPPLTAPKHGSFIDSTCSSTKQKYQVKCAAICNSGYNFKGPSTLQCTKNGTWDHNHVGICEKAVQAPQLTCGKDITVVLKKGESTADISALLQPPQVKNADPAAVKRKPANFDPAKAPYGRTALQYNVMNSAGQDYCAVVVVVQDHEKPTVTGCPQTIHTKTGGGGKAVSWKEPLFQDNVKILRVDQTRHSGSQFYIGKTEVKYEALDLAKNSVQCKFDVIVEHIECTPPKIRHGHFQCQKFGPTTMCAQQCDQGYAAYIFFVRAFCNNADQGFNSPLRDCVPSVPRKSKEEKCPDGYVPQIQAISPLCVKCPIGTYQDGTDKCTDCPPGKTTKAEGTRDIKDCQ